MGGVKTFVPNVLKTFDPNVLESTHTPTTYHARCNHVCSH